MPATYSVRAKKQPAVNRFYESQQKKTAPKERKYYVLGIEVDQETYRKYEMQLYPLLHDTLGEVQTDLLMVQHYATEEHAREYPVEAESARKILAQIKKEIEETKRKDEKTMNEKKNAVDFMAELNKIYTESRAAYDALQAPVNAAKDKMDLAYEAMRDPTCEDTQIAQRKYLVAKDEYQIAEDERRNAHQRMVDAHDQKVKELRAQFEAYLGSKYAASPDSIDAAAMQLLTSGICKASDLAHMAERYSDNPTMLRIVGSYANKLAGDAHIGDNDKKLCRVVAHKANMADGGQEKRIFDEAVECTKFGLGKDYTHAVHMHEIVVGQAMDGYRQRMEGLYADSASKVQPAEE